MNSFIKHLPNRSKYRYVLLCLAVLFIPLEVLSSSGYVGDKITLTRPSIPYGAKDKGCQFSSSASELIVYSYSSYGVVEIKEYFTGSRTVECDNYYMAVIGKNSFGQDIWNSYHYTTNFTITCNPIQLTNIPSNLKLTEGQEYDINWSYSPSSKKKPKVEFSSDNTSVVTVNSYGNIRAVRNGSATIKLKNHSGPDVQISVTVSSPDPILVTSVTLNSNSVEMAVNDRKQLYATISPSNATNKNVSWSTSNRDVATVSDGLVTATGIGSATITCEAIDGSGKKDFCYVTVSSPDPVPVTGVSLNYSTLSLKVDETRTLYPTITPSNATDKTVSWTSSNSSVATVNSNGLVTAVERGKATITCKANGGNGVQATCDITVASVKDYSYFTVKTAEGVEVKYYVQKVADGVCVVYYGAIDKSTTGKITIPSEVEGLKVTSISWGAFRDCVGITSVSVPSTVTSIGSSAFSGCTGLTSVSLGNGVKELGSYAFYGCTSLTTITGISSLESIGSSAFRGESYNTYIPWYNNLPDGLLYLGKVLYKYKGTMPENTTVDVKDGTTMIGYEAFYGQNGLVGITIPQSVKTISYNPLECCKNLTSIKVASGNTIYDSRGNCNAIIETATNVLIAGCKTTNIPSTVSVIGDNAFYGSSIESVVIPNDVDSIGSYAFGSCSSLTSVVIGKGLRKLYHNPFFSCRIIRSISVVSDNPYLDSRNNCNAIIETATDKLITGCDVTEIPANVKVIGYDAFCNVNKPSVTIPDEVEQIEQLAFQNMPYLRSLTIGKNVKQIDKQAFYSCYGLRAIHSLMDEPCEIEENVFGYSGERADTIYKNATLYVPIGSKTNYLTTPGWNKFKNIVEIADDATYEGLVFTVKTVEGETLYLQVTDAKGKTCEVIGAVRPAAGKVTIPREANGYTITAIGENAFYSNNSRTDIAEVVIPESVTSIGDYAFDYCENLRMPVIPPSVKSIGKFAFSYCKGASITIPASVKEIGRGFVAYCPSLTTIIVDSGNSVYDSRDNSNAIIETTTNTLVAGCTGTKIPATVTSIGMNAFSGCGSTEIIIPANVSAIDNYAFASCRSLTSITTLIEEPFDVDSLVFSIYNSDDRKYYFTEATLYVPIGTKAKYQTAGGWKYFTNIIESLKGDVNEDGKVNGTDLVALTNIILGKNPEKKAADVNGDGKVNGTDYVALANIILGKASARQMADDVLTKSSMATLQIEPCAISAGETKELIVSLTNRDDALTLLQFDMMLPKGLSIQKMTTARTKQNSHQVATYNKDGIARFLMASSSNELIEGSEGAVLRLMVTADASFDGGVITLQDILGVTPDEQEVLMPTRRYNLTGGTTGIYNIGIAEEGSAIYSLSGQRQTVLKKGVNIVNGKKVIKK